MAQDKVERHQIQTSPYCPPSTPPSRPLEGRGGGGACTDPDPGLSLPIRADGAAGRVSLRRDVLIVT